MHEVLEDLPPGARVLDLGSGAGSFQAPGTFTVRLDLEDLPPVGRSARVCADAAHLPFLDDSFHAVISNHSLEHIHGLESALGEIGRILAGEGALYIAVPDASSWSDRLYRWLASGGGHINAFNDPDRLGRRVSRLTGLPLRGVRKLHASLSFLNRENPANCPPRKARWMGLSSEFTLRWISRATRALDRQFGWGMSHYGWALYFGQIGVPIQEDPWINVCIRCGSGFASDWLVENASVEPGWVGKSYLCPSCDARNFFFDSI